MLLLPLHTVENITATPTDTITKVNNSDQHLLTNEEGSVHEARGKESQLVVSRFETSLLQDWSVDNDIEIYIYGG